MTAISSIHLSVFEREKRVGWRFWSATMKHLGRMLELPLGVYGIIFGHSKLDSRNHTHKRNLCAKNSQFSWMDAQADSWNRSVRWLPNYYGLMTHFLF